MHVLTFVLVPKKIEKPEIPKFVDAMLAPYYVLLFPEDYDGCYPPNPNAEWDEWCVGGRWDGLLPEQVTIGECERLEANWARNIVRVENLPPDIIPAVIVTPDGRWHDEFEIEKCPERETKWNDLAKAMLAKHQYCFAVIVDHHRW